MNSGVIRSVDFASELDGGLIFIELYFNDSVSRAVGKSEMLILSSARDCLHTRDSVGAE